MVCPLFFSSKLLSDIEYSINVCRQEADLNEPDHLCCGRAGSIRFLLLAGCQLGRADCIKRAREQMDVIIKGRDLSGSFQIVPGVNTPMFNPTLFRGSAGVGLSLLELNHALTTKNNLTPLNVIKHASVLITP